MVSYQKIFVFSLLLNLVSQTGATGLSKGTTYALPSGSQYPIQAVFSSNGLYLATADSNSQSVTMFNVGRAGQLSGATSYLISLPELIPTSLTFSPGSAYLATSNSSGSVSIFTVSANGTLTGPVTYALPSGSSDPVRIAFSPNGLSCYC